MSMAGECGAVGVSGDLLSGLSLGSMTSLHWASDPDVGRSSLGLDAL